MSTDGARAALNLSGTVLGYYPVRVLPSKTAILPVNPTFLPRVRILSIPFKCVFAYLGNARSSHGLYFFFAE